MRWMLFSGWASVRPSELTWTPYRNRRIFGSVTPYRCAVSSSHSCDEGAHLAGLLDEPHAGVDEEGDPADDRAEVLLGHLAGRPHGVEDGDRRAQRVRQLLLRRRAGLLQVVAADVDRVPLRDLVHRVGDHVADQPQRVLGREHVGPAGEVLLDDVVLGRAGELVGDLGGVEPGFCSSAATW